MIGIPQPTLTWFKDGTPIERAYRPPEFSPYQAKPRQQLLRIPQLTDTDEGNFTCVASNAHGSVAHSYTVEVQRYLVHKPRLVRKY